jgi:geranylgeranyl diphosphate synthase type II
VSGLRQLGQYLGAAFQIKDDMLDVSATTDALGKPAHSDEKKKKNTYVSVMGMERAEADYQRLSYEAGDMLKSIGLRTDSLTVLVDVIINRSK